MTKSHERANPHQPDTQRQNSYQKDSSSPAANRAPDIQQPGAAGDFGGGEPARKLAPASTAAQDKGKRTPGDQPGLNQQTGKDGAADPKDAGEAANPYAGT